MKKVFISCPTNGRTKENIMDTVDQLYKIAKIITGEELDPIFCRYSDDDFYDDKPLVLLGESIKRMQFSDYYISPHDVYGWPECDIERQVALKYGIKVLDISTQYVAPDALDTLYPKTYIQYEEGEPVCQTQ